MPTYEYRCSAGHEFEQFQRMSEEPLRTCRICGAPAERLLSAGGGLLFKGSGFYITDYRSDSYRKAAEAETGSKPKSEGAKGSGDAKPEGAKGSGDAKPGGASGGGATTSGGSGTAKDSA